MNFSLAFSHRAGHNELVSFKKKRVKTYIFSGKILTLLVAADCRLEALYFSQIFQLLEFVFDVCVD